jgi:hypothetical protein
LSHPPIHRHPCLSHRSISRHHFHRTRGFRAVSAAIYGTAAAATGCLSRTPPELIYAGRARDARGRGALAQQGRGASAAVCSRSGWEVSGRSAWGRRMGPTRARTLRTSQMPLPFHAAHRAAISSLAVTRQRHSRQRRFCSDTAAGRQAARCTQLSNGRRVPLPHCAQLSERRVRSPDRTCENVCSPRHEHVFGVKLRACLEPLPPAQLGPWRGSRAVRSCRRILRSASMQTACCAPNIGVTSSEQV